MAGKKKKVFENGLKMIGEIALIPGTSQFVDGRIKSGVIHAVAGLTAGAVLGAPAFLAVCANSLSISLTKRSLFDNIFGSKDEKDLKLEARVNAKIKEGLNLEEIRETLLEDVEDLYLEATDEINES